MVGRQRSELYATDVLQRAGTYQQRINRLLGKPCKGRINVTGLSDLASNLQGSRLQLLREVAPSASVVGVVFNPGTPYAALAYKELGAAAEVFRGSPYAQPA